MSAKKQKVSAEERVFLFSSESVNEGHPDKLADQVSDAVLDACLTADPMSKVRACTGPPASAVGGARARARSMLNVAADHAPLSPPRHRTAAVLTGLSSSGRLPARRPPRTTW